LTIGRGPSCSSSSGVSTAVSFDSVLRPVVDRLRAESAVAGRRRPALAERLGLNLDVTGLFEAADRGITLSVSLLARGNGGAVEEEYADV